jgi:hypothetical protein
MTDRISREDRCIAESDIARLVHTYCHRLDAGDFGAVGAMFDHATWQLSPEIMTTGSAEKVAVLNEAMMLYDGRPGTRHMVGNLVIDVADDGQSARSVSYVLTSQVAPGFPLQLISQARYEDTFVRGDAGWRFASRVVHSDGVGDMSHHQKSAAR